MATLDEAMGRDFVLLRTWPEFVDHYRKSIDNYRGDALLTLLDNVERYLGPNEGVLPPEDEKALKQRWLNMVCFGDADIGVPTDQPFGVVIEP